MQAKSSRIRTKLLVATGAYRIIVLFLTFFIIRYVNEKTNFNFSSFHFINMIILALSSASFFFLLHKKSILLALICIEFYVSLSFSYPQPHFMFLEVFWIPGLIVILTLIFPKIPALVAALFLCLGGSVFLSYGCNNNVSVEILGFYFPWAAVLMVLFALCALLFALLSRICLLLEAREKRISSLEENLTKLDEINNAISQRIFTITNDTTQKERNRLSKEIHDTVGYVFINIMMILQAAEAVIFKDTKRSEKLINDTLNYAEKSINEIRYLLRNIRSYTPSSLTLQNELHDVGEAFEIATNVKIDLHYGEWPSAFSRNNVESFYISFMQESFTNALKHGHADYISVICWKRDMLFGMTVTDNGSGAELPIKKGIGITAMEDVAEELGGEIKIITDKNGFSISAVLPALQSTDDS